MSSQPETTAELERKAAKLRQNIIDTASAAPESSAIPEVLDFRSSQSALQQEIRAAKERVEELTQARRDYETLEQAVSHAQRESASATSDLERIYQPLGNAAFEALLSGQTSEQPVFSDRMGLNTLIAELRKEYDSLTPRPDGGILDKIKAKARRWAVAGMIKLEERRIGGLETQIGKRLLDLDRELSVQCNATESVLRRIAAGRASVAQAQQQLEQTTAVLETKRAGLRTAFGLPQVEGVRSLDIALTQCRESLAKKENGLSALRSDLPGKLLAASELPDGEPLVEVVNELRQVHLSLRTVSTPSNAIAAKVVELQAALSRTMANLSHTPAKRLANQKVGWIMLVIVVLSLALIGQCDLSNSRRPPLTTDEQRASQKFQDSLGASRGEADRAARMLNQMLERDRQRGR